MKEVSAMPPYFWRSAYIAEFLLALLAILTFWGEVGGENHLDLMPWYAKFALSGGLALAIVTATVSAVSDENPWNAKTLRSVIAALLLAGAMAGAIALLRAGIAREEADNSLLSGPKTRASAATRRIVDLKIEAPLR